MRIGFAPNFIEKFPEFTRYVVVARGISNYETNHQVKQMLDEACTKASRIDPWRKAFKKMGLDPDEFKPSVQSLVERVWHSDLKPGDSSSESAFAYHNTIVALSNLVSIKYLIPSGADDLGLIQGDCNLQLANGKEIFIGFASNDIEHPEPGEVILADQRKVMCRRWVWQQGAHTMVSKETENALVNIDILPPVTPEEGRKIADELASLIREYCGGVVEIFVLNKNHPQFEIETPPATIKENVYDILEMRGYIQKTSDRAEVRRLLGEGTTIYQGFDPTKPSLHVGHLMSLMVFHYLQQAGNKMIFILGGGTAQVGDPSDRAVGRKMITTEEVAENGRYVKAQVQGIGLVNFDSDKEEDGKPAAMLIDNSEWLHMDLLEFTREVTRHFSVNNMVKRDDFRRRLENNENLSLFEFIYTTLQGYDYLVLFDRYDCRIQMGGNDQWKNILDGMDLIHRTRGKDCYGMAFPLLLDPTGQKMGKTSTGKTIWLASEGEYSLAPFEFFQYWVNSPDQDLERNFKLFTFLPLEEIATILAGHPKDAQYRLAFEVTKIVHGEEIARRLIDDAQRAFKGTGLPTDVPTVKITEDEAKSGVPLINILTQVGVKSRGDARRLIIQGGVVLNETRLGADDMMRNITMDDLKDYDGLKAAVIRFGKGRAAKIVLG